MADALLRMNSAIEELENYMRDKDDYDICIACASPMDATHGMAAHDELCPLGVVIALLRATEDEFPQESCDCVWCGSKKTVDYGD